MARLVHCERSAEERVKDFGEGYRCLTPEEAMVEARRCVRRACDVASCEIACPMRSDIRLMMQLVAAGDFTEAARVLGQRNNSADICARVCPHDMADNFFRPGFTQGVWANGEPAKGLSYLAFVGNGLNTLSISANKIDTHLLFSGSAWWEPLGAYGEPGKSRNMYDDYFAKEDTAPLLRIPRV